MAFSIGGTIAWQAALQGLNVRKLLAFSSTRLRHETLKPDSDIRLWYGAKDLYQPGADWFESIGIDYQILNKKEHELYLDIDLIIQLIKPILK